MKLLKRLGPYMDDLLLIAGGCCCVSAAGLALGAVGAFAAAGLWLTVLAVIVAKGKDGDDHAPAAGDDDAE